MQSLSRFAFLLLLCARGLASSGTECGPRRFLVYAPSPLAPETFVNTVSRTAAFHDLEDRIQAMDDLGHSGDSKAVPVLLKILNNSRELSFVRGVAATNLGLLGSSEAVPALIDFLQSRETYSCDAAKALGRIGDPKAIPVLLSIQKTWALDSLGHYRLSTLMLPLANRFFENLEHQDSYYASISAVALGLLGDKRVVPALRAVYESTKVNNDLPVGHAPKPSSKVVVELDGKVFVSNGVRAEQLDSLEFHLAVALAYLGDKSVLPTIVAGLIERKRVFLEEYSSFHAVLAYAEAGGTLNHLPPGLISNLRQQLRKRVLDRMDIALLDHAVEQMRKTATVSPAER